MDPDDQLDCDKADKIIAAAPSAGYGTHLRPRMICWFSCGAPSAVTAKICLRDYAQNHEVLIVNCDTRSSEHGDNYRFSDECEQWFGVPIIYLKSQKYGSVDEVFNKTRYMAGVAGARCTTELKKLPRLAFARPDDIHCFGYTSGEKDRASDFESNNPDMHLKWVLIERGFTKADCILELLKANIEIPAMYRLGFDNNNCPGCVKASSPWYWDMVRTHFPATFTLRCQQSRAIGCRLVEIRHHERIFLDELPAGPFHKNKREDLSCGPGCGIQTRLALT